MFNPLLFDPIIDNLGFMFASAVLYVLYVFVPLFLLYHLLSHY